MKDQFYRSRVYKSYKFRESFNGVIFVIVRAISNIALLMSIIYVVLYKFDVVNIGSLQGWVYIVLGISLIVLIIDIFISVGLNVDNNTDIREEKSKNIFDNFDYDCMKLLDLGYKIASENKIHQLDLALLILVFKQIDLGRVFMVRSGLYVDNDLQDMIINTAREKKHDSSTEEINKKFFYDCIKNSKANQHQMVTFYDFVWSLYKNNKFFAHVVNELGIDENDLVLILSWNEKILFESKKKYYWQKDYYPPGIGQDWASGFTPSLNIFSSDISQYLVDAQLEYQSQTREDIVSQMEDILSKSGRNNILLIGDNGVGKTTTVNILTQKIVRGKSNPSINYKHVVQLDTARLMAGVSSKSELEARFISVFNEAVYAGNIILFIKNLDTLIDSRAGQIGSVNAVDLIMPYLESDRIQVIATIGYDNYKNKLQANTNLETFFSKIEMKEMSKEDVLPSIENLIVYTEIKHKIIFRYQAVRQLIELSSRYIHDEVFPQKAIDLLSEVAVVAEKNGRKIVEIDEVSDFVSKKIKMPLGKIKEREKNKLLKLEEVLHQRIIGQDEAILAISNALRRARAGLSGEKRPIGSFLFIGPTGVGKTETAKALAYSYYGSEKNMIRFDMSEFQQMNTIDRLIGAKSVSQFIPGRLTQGVKNNPYTLILFDEIEKAHPNILNLLLQILDEGKLTDASGREIDFTDTIIICTSNAGSEKIRQYLNDNASAESLGKVIVNYLLGQGLFKPEFINRFDKVVCYKPLNINEISQIVQLMIKKLHKNLSDKKIRLEISDEVLDILARKGYDPVFGARPLRRLIQEQIENLIAKKIISEEVEEGGSIVIQKEDIDFDEIS